MQPEQLKYQCDLDETDWENQLKRYMQCTPFLGQWNGSSCHFEGIK